MENLNNIMPYDINNIINNDNLLVNTIKEYGEINDSSVISDDLNNFDYCTGFSFNDKNNDDAFVKEHNERIMNTSEFKTYFIYQSILNNSTKIMSGKEKRLLRRDIERKVKKGKYDYIFTEEYKKRIEEKNKLKFNELNQ